MSYGYGGGGSNPYDQRGNAPAQGGYGAPAPQNYGGRQYGNAPAPKSYGSQQYGNAPAMGRDEFSGEGTNVEMEPLTPNGAQPARQGGRATDPVLAECDAIGEAITGIEQSDLPALRTIQMSILNNPDPGASSKNLDEAGRQIMKRYTGLVGRVRILKSKPNLANYQQVHVGRLGRQLEAAMNQYRNLEREFEKKLKEQMARQYRIVRPEASEQEVTDAVEDVNQQQVFSQALMQSNRRGQAQSAMSAVQSRHDELRKIEQQMIDLGTLFNDMNVLVEQQEVPVANIEMKGEEVVENMDKGNEQLTVGIKSARNARKWKWWCLGIVVLIIVIIVIIVLIYKFVIQNNNPATTKSNKRDALFIPPIDHRVVSGQPWAPTEERSVVPGLKWTRDNTLASLTAEKPVVPGVGYTPSSKKARSFQA